ncbi:MAG: bifunctional 4-hydroxy-3-methylbut-2-enyl diphosphate reductase/30S ribosomal protein S1 [Clostridiaceae bacterium]
MNVKLAPKSGFCFGVKRAVDEAIEASNSFNKRIYTLGPLIHNNSVVNYLIENDIHPIELKDINELNTGDVIIIRSHGVPKAVIEELDNKKFNIINATCPFVSNIHKIVNKYYNLGYGIVIVGDSNHPEVIGINGWCENNAIISSGGENLDSIPKKICIVAQTTEKKESWEKVLNIVTKKAEEVISFNTICTATAERQRQADELSKQVDVMVVIGGRQSSNTTKLYEICKRNCKNTIYVENSGEIPEEIINSKKIKKIGVTAGASTPDWIIKEAILKMSDEKNLEMNEQLAYMEEYDKRVAVGDVVKGTIITINEKQAFLNIGYKADGLLPLEEVSKDPSVNLNDLYKVSDEINVKVISRRNEDGYVVLSKIEIERQEAYEALKQAFENKSLVEVEVREVVKGGVLAFYKNVRIFIPASHLELYHIEDLNKFVGENLEVSIIEYNQIKRTTKIVGSRRSILKVEQKKVQDSTWEKLEEGQIVKGEVRRLTDFGAFLNIDGVDGLLHVSEISWGRVSKPADVLKINDIVEVCVLTVDKEKRKLSLSLKKLVENPWENVETKYPIESVVLGKVVRFCDFGVFIELEPGVDALAHISQISHKRINKPSEVLEIGEMVKAKILDVNKETKKIGLSIKEVNEI